jgi:hypothetical protein
MDLESPFEKQNNLITLYLEPVLDPYQNTYINVLTLSGIPNGPLSKMTRQINTPKLSPFQTSSTIMSPFPNCMYMLTRYPNKSISITNNWMLEDDIPSVFSYLQSNNYTIETSLTKLMTKNNYTSNNSQTRFSGNRKTICIFSYSL